MATRGEHRVPVGINLVKQQSGPPGPFLSHPKCLTAAGRDGRLPPSGRGVEIHAHVVSEDCISHCEPFVV